MIYGWRTWRSFYAQAARGFSACTELPLRSVRTLADGVPRREATQAWSRRRSCGRRRSYTLSIKCSVQHVALGNNEAGFRISLLRDRPLHKPGCRTLASCLDSGYERVVGHFPDQTFGCVPGGTRSALPGGDRVLMRLAQHAPGFDRPCTHGTRRLFDGDIGLGWPWYDNWCSGAVESGDRPINGVELIGQFSTFLFEQASYLIRVNHCHSRGFAVMGMCCDWTWCSVQRVALATCGRASESSYFGTGRFTSLGVGLSPRVLIAGTNESSGISRTRPLAASLAARALRFPAETASFMRLAQHAQASAGSTRRPDSTTSVAATGTAAGRLPSNVRRNLPHRVNKGLENVWPVDVTAHRHITIDFSPERLFVGAVIDRDHGAVKRHSGEETFAA